MEYAQGLQYAKAQNMKNNTKAILPNTAVVGGTEMPQISTDSYNLLFIVLHGAITLPLTKMKASLYTIYVPIVLIK